MDPTTMLHTVDTAKCEEPAVYDTLWKAQQEETSYLDWKRKCLTSDCMHSFYQISASPFPATEYILERHAQSTCGTRYEDIIDSTRFPEASVIDDWMLTQLSNPSCDWTTAQCPEPDNKVVEKWWYSMLTGVDDEGLLALLKGKYNEPEMQLELPSNSFNFL